jgi:hypothetical protein
VPDPDADVVVDAQNVRRSVWPNISDRRLVDLCAGWAERHGHRVLLVFDGAAPEGRGGCETVAAPHADDWIAETAARLDRYWLVTSDRELRRRAGSRAAKVVGGGAFARELLGGPEPACGSC